MINLSIGKTTDTNGATLYTLTPSPVVLGNQNANAVDKDKLQQQTESRGKNERF